MRLLNATSLELEEFFDDNVPRYAILSHRWEGDEVLFQHMQDGSASDKKGYAKIKQCCDRAVKDGLGFAWVDTCCIYKSSSAELTEAINSMYGWYQNSAVCYAYLFDVVSTEVSLNGDFSKSSWWTRGWTLQELLVPPHVEFYNSTWYVLGTKKSLMETISAITDIDIRALEGKNLDNFSIAQKMSWASKRITTRLEDVAYSLLGIFGVNMPMLYGEGQRAFLRLQEEILKQSDDHSLFAWSCPDTCYRGLLAKSPSYFSECSNIVRSSAKLSRTPYSITNMGLAVEFFMAPWAMETYIAALDCEDEGPFPYNRRGIFLKLLPEQDQYARVMVDGKDILTFPPELLSEGQYIETYVRQQVWGVPRPSDRTYGFLVRYVPSTMKVDLPKLPSRNYDHQLSRVHSWHEWNSERPILEIPPGSRGTAGELWYSCAELGDSALKLGFDPFFNPVCMLEGPLWEGPLSAPVLEPENRSFNERMEPSWMLKPHRNLHKGFRLKGLCRYTGCAKISIYQMEPENQQIWAVDIEHYGRKDRLWEHVRCNACLEVSFLHSFALYLGGLETHPDLEHLWATLQMSDVPRFRLLL
jgi:hypothetical protein